MPLCQTVQKRFASWVLPKYVCLCMYTGCVENGLFNLSLKFNLMKIHCFKYLSCWESCIVRYRSYANDERQQRRKVYRMVYVSTGLAAKKR